MAPDKDTEETRDTKAALETATDEQTEAADTAAKNLHAKSAVRRRGTVLMGDL